METQMKFNPVELWLDTLAYSKSGSENTQRNYRRNFKLFLDFIGKTAEDILREYESSKDRDLKRRYARLLKAWMGSLSRQGYTNGSIRTMVGGVQSFFKYNDLPLGYVPSAQDNDEYHNRDITKEEIAHLLEISRARDRAFFAVMAQSGLRPHELCMLQLKHLQTDLYSGTVPCKIKVPKEIAKRKYHGYFTFIGAEAVKHLRAYLKVRANITSESHLFTRHGTEQAATPKSFTHKFERNMRKLKAKGLVDFKQKEKGKPAELRLYCLRKFFKKFAHQAGSDFVQFWMGHTLGVTDHYFTRDLEFHRQQYKEKAMLFLRIEARTPTETEETIKDLQRQLANRDKKISDMRWRMRELTEVIRDMQQQQKQKA